MHKEALNTGNSGELGHAQFKATTNQTENSPANGIRFQELAESISDVFFAMKLDQNSDLRYTYWNKESENLTGIPAKEALGKTIQEIFPDNEGRRQMQDNCLQVIKTKQPKRWIVNYPGDEHIIHKIRAYPSKEGVSVIANDITEQIKIENQLKMYQSIVENAVDAISVKDLDGHYIYVNEAFTKRHNLTQKEIIGKTAFDLYSTGYAEQITKEAEQVTKTKLPNIVERQLALGSEQRNVENTIMPLLNISGEAIGTFNISRDITQRKQIEEKILYNSFHDELTGLDNRRSYEKVLDRFQNSRRYPITIFSLDLDNLKKINDGPGGHAAGDELIKKTAEVLKETFPRTEDIKCRIGGDEFIVIVSEVQPEIIEKLSEKLKLNLQNAQTPASIGIATAGNWKESLRETAKEADKKMYFEKNKKKSR